MVEFILILTLSGGFADDGRSIVSIEFASKGKCEIAGQKWLNSMNSVTNRNIIKHAICVEK